MTQKLGIIGVGHLAGSLLTGLARAGWSMEDIRLSPRGQSTTFAQAYGCQRCDSNDAVLAGSDLMLLAVRPADAPEVMADLPFSAHHVVLSACAGVPLHVLQDAAPAPTILRIMPITAAELGASPTLVYPMHPAAAAFLETIGTVIPLEREADFDVGSVSAALYGWAQRLIIDAASWSSDAGLDPQTARQLIAQTFVAAGRMMAEKEAPMENVLASLITPGGITEAGLNHLETKEISQAWTGACDVVLEKLQGKATEKQGP